MKKLKLLFFVLVAFVISSCVNINEKIVEVVIKDIKMQENICFVDSVDIVSVKCLNYKTIKEQELRTIQLMEYSKQLSILNKNIKECTIEIDGNDEKMVIPPDLLIEKEKLEKIVLLLKEEVNTNHNRYVYEAVLTTKYDVYLSYVLEPRVENVDVIQKYYISASDFSVKQVEILNQ